MSAEVELLREAAERMRALACAATPGPWEYKPELINGEMEAILSRSPDVDLPWGRAIVIATPLTATEQVRHDLTYAASWHPIVALAVADWLDYAARVLEHLEQRGHKPTDNGYTSRAVAVARVYLGRAES